MKNWARHLAPVSSKAIFTKQSKSVRSSSFKLKLIILGDFSFCFWVFYITIFFRNANENAIF